MVVRALPACALARVHSRPCFPWVTTTSHDPPPLTHAFLYNCGVDCSSPPSSCFQFTEAELGKLLPPDDMAARMSDLYGSSVTLGGGPLVLESGAFIDVRHLVVCMHAHLCVIFECDG